MTEAMGWPALVPDLDRSAELIAEWREPPPPGKAGVKTKVLPGVAAALRQRPGEWAVIEKQHGTIASYIKQGKGEFAPGGFEATSRRRQDSSSKSDVYARYVGGEQ